MPLVVKAIVIGAVLIFLWYDFIRYCRKKRGITGEKREDSFKFTCCREKMDHIGENARKSCKVEELGHIRKKCQKNPTRWGERDI